MNDVNVELIDLLETLNTLDKTVLFAEINELIESYDLSRSERYGYAKYECDSSKGLGSYNKERYLKLRHDFNRRSTRDRRRSVMLYVLIVYAFNNQLRFNKNGEFNLPVGKRDFNLKMQRKLSDFVDKLKLGRFEFKRQNFIEYDATGLSRDDFIYADPPYLITCAAYNEQRGWGDSLEQELLNFLDRATDQGVRFALSNVLASDGKTNTLLQDWLKKNKQRYWVHHVVSSYSNASYHKKDRTSGSQEVLITNYRQD